ncbi:hypothetical protein [Pelagicoccus sp. SDUM812003]|uniref:hypothetical protein n=1 Tax=Pelagicoccus sp. SDUM812003 TaxID=3041267 RepID=UPI00280D4DC3|nr:hypothetical protein [Pelagicoccus sp. SDUM812003]MDQ8203702.1 hypothetical protein [Pelagicoccus sp. SDUM812003]
MILGQLIQTGRRFCECRSRDFIPESEDTIVVIAYSIHDRFLAHSFDISLPNLNSAINAWLEQCEAIAYILIHREPKNYQEELPSPIGRPRMDRISLTAATTDSFKLCSFYLQESSEPDAYRLIETNCRLVPVDFATTNLFSAAEREEEPSFSRREAELTDSISA